MKFFYCVRAASKNESQQLPIGDMITSTAVDIVNTNAKHDYLSTDSTDPDQSSDADSEIRSDIGESTAVINGSRMSLAQTTHDEPINSTSADALNANSTKSLSGGSAPSTTKNTSITSTVTPSTTTSTSLGKSTHSSHSSENQKKEMKLISSENIKKELNLSPTTSGKTDNASTADRLGGSAEKHQSEQRSNGTSPKPNTSKRRSSNGMWLFRTIITESSRTVYSIELILLFSFADCKLGGSPSRSNQDIKDSKEKVKTKSTADGVNAQSKDSVANRLESTNRHKSSSTSEKSSPSRSTAPDAKSNAERTKNRFLFHKEEKAKSLSPPLSAECEYDFDQHLLKEKLSEKKKFLSSIHLTPRVPTTESPSVQLPKLPTKVDQKTDTSQVINLSKDTKSVTTNSNASIKTPATSTQFASDKLQIKKPENKASKRKSREPVKNVAKIKCLTPSSDRSGDSKSEPSKSPNVSSGVAVSSSASSSTSSPSSSSATSTSNAQNDRRMMERLVDEMSQQNKNNLKQTLANANKSFHSLASSTASTSSSSKSVFKTPSSSNAPSSHKQTPTSESETSIIINNVQRPNQADTPRPSMSFKSAGLNQQQPFYYSPNRSFPNETEIQELRNDDASKVKVYGPAMSMAKPFEAHIPALGMMAGADLITQPFPSALFNRYKHAPVNYQQLASSFQFLQQFQNNLPQHLLPEMFKNNKSKKSALEMKKSGTSSSDMDAIGSSINQKSNSIQKGLQQMRQTADGDSLKGCPKQQKMQSLLNSCKIPSSLSITLTNEETESLSRSIFNNKNSNVVNSIEIVKLSDEGSNDTTPRYPAATSSPSNLIQTIEKESTRTASPVAINLVNNQSTSSTPPMPPMTSESYQAKFLQSLIECNKPLENLKKKQKPIKVNRPLTPSQQPPSYLSGLMFEELGRELQKRKQESLDPKSAEKAMKVRKLQRPIFQQKSSSPTQRPLPELVVVKDQKSLSPSTSNQPSTSGSAMNSLSAFAQTNNKDRQSPTVSTSSSNTATMSTDAATVLALAVTQAKMQKAAAETAAAAAAASKPKSYSPLQTSPMPIWTNHMSEIQLASHKALVENLSQNKKNTFVE